MNFINNYIQPITLGSGDTSLALSLPDGEYRLTIADGASSATRWEIVGAVVEDGAATLTRGLEGTPVQEWTVGSVIYCAVTAETLERIEQTAGQPGGTEVNVQTSTAYTLVLADAFKMVTMDSADANTLTVPPNSAVAFPANTRIDLGQDGAGQTTIVAGAGVTIRTPESLKLRKQWSKASLIRRAADVWDLVGDLEAATPVEPLPTVIGEPAGGGFYAGDIEYPDGQWYKLIVADVSADITGENARWKTEGTETPGTDHDVDGAANTAAMVAAGIELHPAAAHCVNHRGGDFEDWYMPAIEELYVIRENLSPALSDGPPDFQDGGPQAFSGVEDYWASTQFSNYPGNGWIYNFWNDSASYDGKTETEYRVRPVRRVPFSP